MEVSTLKLILKGQNTTDDNTLEFYGVKEGDFLVVMQTKVIPQYIYIYSMSSNQFL